MHPDDRSASDPIPWAAPGLQVPEPPARLFTRAAALCAKRAASGGATTAEVEAILARGLAQATRVDLADAERRAAAL